MIDPAVVSMGVKYRPWNKTLDLLKKCWAFGDTTTQLHTRWYVTFERKVKNG